MEQSAVSAQHLAIGYSLGKGRWKTVHPCVDFTLNLGELTSLIGLNGAGKSTLIKTLCRFQPPVGGSVSVMGKDVREYAPHEFALTVGVVLTDRTNAGGLTVRELVSLGRQPHTGFLGHLGDRDRIVVSAAMDSVGISHKADSYVSELSDGERQRAMIAKALAQECPVIVLDEPTAFLDVASRIETMSLLHETARRPFDSRYRQRPYILRPAAALAGRRCACRFRLSGGPGAGRQPESVLRSARHELRCTVWATVNGCVRSRSRRGRGRPHCQVDCQCPGPQRIHPCSSERRHPLCTLSVADLSGSLSSWLGNIRHRLLHLAGGVASYRLQGLEVARLTAWEEVGMEDGGQVLQNPCRVEHDVVVVCRRISVAAEYVLLPESPEL